MTDLIDLLRPIEGDPHVIMVLGKGGVGKTSMSILISSELSRLGKTLLVSFDPAKHILKYLDISRPAELFRISNDFFVSQLNIEASAKELISKYSSLINDLFPSLSVLNLEDITKALKYAPGIEEEVFLNWLCDIYDKKDFKFVVVDTPPTGISLRTLTLPKLYLLWLEKLINIRERIVSLRYVIARTLGREVKVSDPVLVKLYEMREKYSKVKEALTNLSRTSFVVVTNPEPLPMYELKEVLKFLSEELSTNPKLLVMNKVLPENVAERLGTHEEQKEIINEFMSLPGRSIMIPYASNPPSKLEDILKLREVVVVVRGA
ncbi:MAG: ArsA family ATPase [Desulfurococcaceae archaeon TW002]